MKKILIKILIVFSSLFLIMLSINIYMLNYSSPYIFDDINDVPDKFVVIIPGAKVYENTVSFVVRDRIDGALNIVNKNKAQKILISGDHGRKVYDEVNEMKFFMMKYYDVDENIVFLDHAGFSTYETMYRADEIFDVKDAVIVTQSFHCARSVYIARKKGIDAVAYQAPEINKFSTKTHAFWQIREFLARVKTFFLVLFDVEPTYLGEKIPITGSANFTWDK